MLAYPFPFVFGLLSWPYTYIIGGFPIYLSVFLKFFRFFCLTLRGRWQSEGLTDEVGRYKS